MKAETRERFGINQGRPRPAYQPKDIHCASCGAGLTVKDEASRLVVCEYCGSHIEVDQDQLKVLGKGDERDWDFPLALGDSFRYKGTRFEVIARIAYVEDNDLLELTREYYLFHPRRGPMWLSEYKGNYSLSTPTHVVPEGNPFTKKRGDLLKTYDGLEWVTEETGVYSLAYVDGALPWIARIGDLVHYAEFTDRSGSGRQFEAQASGDEVEYGIGRQVPAAAVRSATGKSDLPLEQVPLVNAAKKRKGYRMAIAMCGVAVVVNALLAVVCMSSGTLVLQQSFSNSQLNGEVLSKPFDVATPDQVLKIKAEAPSLNNAWMALDVAVVKGDDAVIHVEDADLEYYHGVDGGESWSEGSRSKSVYLEVPEAGTYHLLLHAVSARGSASTASSCEHGLRLSAYEGAEMPHFFVATTVLSLFFLVVSAGAYGAWKKQEDEE